MSISIIGKTNIDFIGMRKTTFIISAIVAIAGIYSLVLMFTGKANLGIEFGGGTMIQGNFDRPMEIGALRDAITDAGFTDATIQELTRAIPNSFVIRTKLISETTAGKGADIEAVLRAAFPDNPFHLDSIHEVGPAVGQTLQKQARLAALISLIGILIYVAVRFDFRFGVAATIAMLHDVFAALAIVYFFNWEVSVLVISAVLTLAGYSLTDKVVVFDRIRENLKMMRRKVDFVPGVNLSINEVLSRTIITSLTTFLATLAIVIAGGEVLREFAALLTIGIAIGTYSSVFVASPIYVEWENRKPKRFK